MRRQSSWLLACLLTVALTAVNNWQATQAEDGNPLTVHIIAHSHCDPGWLNTFEGYYGSEVRTILDAVLRELSGHEHRKFVWSEVSFFNRWYEALNKDMKEQFKTLIRRGQIEFVNGGWVQNDEANPDPVAMINQMATGHEYLLKNFGVAPRIAWQIDPFGHSGVTPSLWSLMGFESLVINRIHHSLKDRFKSNKQMEFLWRGVDMGQKTDMFTHVLHTHYSAPPGFDWEEGAMGIDSNNVGQRARDLSNMMKSRAQAYRSNHLLVPFGDDFKFKSADRQFGNMDRLIEHINQNVPQYGMRIRYSTLSDYFEAVAGSNVKFPVFDGDFFPYADNEDSYWTGYYTTRPLLKQKSRKLNHILRACEQLLVLVRSSPHANQDSEQKNLPAQYWESKFKEVERARMETALFLHHDAITGTSRTNVVQDYQSRMDSASEQLMQIMARMIEHLLTKEPNASPELSPDEFVFAPPESPELKEVFHPVVYYNSLGWIRREVVSLRVSSRNVRILNNANQEIPCQIDAFFDGLNNDDVAPSQKTFTVSFIVEVPPLGATTYYVRIASGSPEESTNVHHSQTTVFLPAERRSKAASTYNSKYLTYVVNDDSQQFIENSFLKVFIDTNTGMVKSIEQKKRNGKSFEFKQSFSRYLTSRSGAYIFRPQGRAEPWQSNEVPTIRITRGPILSTVAIKFHGLDVITSLAGGNNEESAELADHLSIVSTVSTESNQELICSFNSPNMATSEREFFTNSGVQFQRRQTKDGMEAQNFYPMVTGARMTSRSDQRSYTIITTHSMACGSVAAGELQLMMHRSLAQDDGRGLAEAVNDASRLEIPLWISFEHDMPDVTFRVKSIRLNNPLRVFYKVPSVNSADAFMKDDHVLSPAVWGERQHVTISPLKQPLPPFIHLLSLLARDSVSDDIVVRFQNLESAKDKQWVSSLSDLFESTFQVSEVRRATLSLNTLIPMNGRRKRGLTFQPTDDAPTSAYLSLDDTSSNAGPGASQNTNEEGVFLSQAALEKLRQDQEAQKKAAGRRLLEQMELEPESIDVRESAMETESLESPTTSSIARRLFGSGDGDVSSTPLFVVKPLQLHTYIFRLTGSEWAERTQGVMVGVGHSSSTPLEKVVRVTKPKPTPSPPSSKPTDTTPKDDHLTSVKSTDRSGIGAGAAGPSQGLLGRLVDSLGGGGGVATPNHPSYDFSSTPTENILHGHEHTVIPGRTRDAWRLIPSRWEYIVVLLASLTGVGFFMHALRVMSRVGNQNQGISLDAARRGKKSAL